MQRAIVDFDLDEHGDWRARLACGHYQHMRHRPPLNDREWVLSEKGRSEKLGVEIACKRCIDGEPAPHLSDD